MIKVNALALKSVDYRDNDKMISLYSLEKGLIGACVRGAKKAGSKLGFCTQPFCFAEYVLNEKNDRLTVTGATEIESFYNIRLNLHSFYAGCCILEFLLKFTDADAPDEKTFLLAADSLKKLNFADGLPERVLVDFLYKQTEISGYALGKAECFSCGKEAKDFKKAYFDPESAAIVCEDCFTVGMREILVDTAKGLAKIAEGEEVEPAALKYLLKFLNYYFRIKAGEYIYSIDQLIELP